MGCGSGGCSSGGCGSGGCGKKDSSGASSGCSTGGCNKFNVFDWLADFSYTEDANEEKLVEISFKQGSRKDYFKNTHHINCKKGDFIAVETPTGLDVGEVSLTGPLVKLQLKKRKIDPKSDKITRILRFANDSDIDKMLRAKEMEHETMIRSRVISRDLRLNMKIGDVEYQADGRKATFYYIADDRVDFRELIKVLAREFKIKVEMRQIGSRQEAGKIGGIGTCGRELCCSSWLTNFKSVSTNAARYQQLAINQSKLSGQCGRLKCCLNYELDTYLDALKTFPKNGDSLNTKAGVAYLLKKDIFNQKMHYTYKGDQKQVILDVKRVHEILDMNKKGSSPLNLNVNSEEDIYIEKEVKKVDFVDTVGQTTLSQLNRTDKRLKNKRKKANQRKNQKGPNSGNKPKGSGQRSNNKSKGGSNKGPGKPSNRNSNSNKPNNKQGSGKPSNRDPKNPNPNRQKGSGKQSNRDPKAPNPNKKQDPGSSSKEGNRNVQNRKPRNKPFKKPSNPDNSSTDKT